MRAHLTLTGITVAAAVAAWFLSREANRYTDLAMQHAIDAGHARDDAQQASKEVARSLLRHRYQQHPPGDDTQGLTIN